MTHLEEYLQYYSSLKAPGYAVLVTGAWGTGKTFQVKENIPEENRIYVSLYGVRSVEQIHAEVFAAAFPAKAKTRGFLEKFRDKDVGALGFSVPLGFIPDVANAVLRNELKPEKILIFDDLERSGLELQEVLGAINSYVEHKNFRVIVLAHDEDKLMGKEFRSIKEKTFGQTILVEPQITRAFDHFLSDMRSDQSRKFLASHRNRIDDTFLRSNVKSLRILRHVLEDLARLYEALSDQHQKNSDAMVELVDTFTAFGAEIRAGNLKEADLRNRRGVQMGYLMRANRKGEGQPSKPPLVVANDKYPYVDLEGGMLSDDVLVATLIEGRYAVSEIRTNLDNSSHFLVPGDVPPWKVVIHFDELDDDTVEGARARMEQQFEDREVTDSGEMLHIFSLRMMMAENGIIAESVDEVVKQCKSYIDDLLEDRRLPPRGAEWRWYSEFERSYDGFGYWVSSANAEHFRSIFAHLINSREEAFRQTFPQLSEDILRMVREDSKSFLEAVSPTNNGPNPYAAIPFLHEIPVEEFVNAWLDGRPESRRNVDHALENRFRGGQLDRDLKQEKEWALELLKELDARSARESGFSALRIKRLRPRVLIELEQSLKLDEEGIENRAE